MYVCVCVAVGEEIDIHDVLADTMSLNDLVNFFANNENGSDFDRSRRFSHTLQCILMDIDDQYKFIDNKILGRGIQYM